MPRRMTFSEFVDISSKIHSHKYDYSNVKYINNSTKVEIKCPIHGSFYQTPVAHIHQKHGCPRCRQDGMKLPICGVGINDYCGSIKNNGKFIPSYTCWRNMIVRCYNYSELKRHPSYIGCTVCAEWLKFSEFKKWFDNNYREGYEIDKDILSNCSKEYSPSTCVFVPKYINSLFRIRTDSANGMGVFYCKKTKKYMGRFTFKGDTKYTKVFDKREEAIDAYNKLRSSEIIRIAKYAIDAGDIDENVYIAIINKV